MVEEGQAGDDEGLQVGELLEDVAEPFGVRAIVDLEMMRVKEP